jgi:glycosyltransferase involved in cell wall biosynthesis
MPSGGARPHLLYVVWGFPPCRGGGVYRALATANSFAAAGWRVTVLTAEREVFLNYTGADVSLEREVDPSVRVVRVPFAWPALETDISRYGAFRVLTPRLWGKWRKRRDQTPFPEVGYGPWRPVIETAALAIHDEDPVDLVVATANPHVTYTAADRLHRDHGVPYVMDYRDGWTLDVFTGEALNAPDSRAGRWEKRLLDSAREVWFVNEPIRAWYADAFPASADRMHVVANGFDPHLVPEPSTTAPDAGRGLTFGYIGTVSPKVPLRNFIDGWRQARESDDLLRRSRAVVRGYLGYYSTPRADLLSQLHEAADADVRYLGPVAKTQIRSAYEDFDVLLLMLGTGRYVTSGKVFEYIATGLPIVSVHDPGNAASDVLRGYPLWFPCADLEPASIAAALARAAAAAVDTDTATRARCREFADQYRRDRQLDPRVYALASSVGANLEPTKDSA